LSRIEKSSVQICGAVRLLAWPSQNGTPLCASADCQWCSPLQAECGVPRLNRRTRHPGEWTGRLALTADVSPQVFPLVLQAGAFADPYAGGVHGGQPNTSVFGRRFGDGALQETGHVQNLLKVRVPRGDGDRVRGRVDVKMNRKNGPRSAPKSPAGRENAKGGLPRDRCRRRCSLDC